MGYQVLTTQLLCFTVCTICTIYQTLTNFHTTDVAQFWKLKESRVFHLAQPPKAVVKNINDNIEAPFRLNSWVNKDEGKNGFATISLAWPVVNTADNYEVSVSAAYNETWKDPEGNGMILGAGETMGLSTTMLQNVKIGYKFDVKVRAIDCLNRNSDWMTETVEARV